jgi:hypothetical protein
MAESVESFSTTFEVTDVITPNSRKQRGLMRRDLQQQQERVIVEYTQTMTYATTDDSITPDTLATAPFATQEEKTAYVTLLGTSGDTVLEQVTGVSEVIIPAVPTSAPGTPPPTQSPADEAGGLSTAAIIGIACGGGAVVVMAILYFLYCRSGGSKESYKGDDPPLHVSVKDDEISTLAGPAGPPTYGDQRYVNCFRGSSCCVCGGGLWTLSSSSTHRVWSPIALPRWITIIRKLTEERGTHRYPLRGVPLDPTLTINLHWIPPTLPQPAPH